MVAAAASGWTVRWFVGRAGVILLKASKKRVIQWAAAFGGVAVTGLYIKNRWQDDLEETLDEYSTPLLAAGAGIGIILLLVLFTRR